MQYEIAHCHHATEGAVSRLWYTMSWLEEVLPQTPVPTCPRLQPPSASLRGEGADAEARFIHTTTCSWDQTNQRARWLQYISVFGEDSWHLYHRWRSMLDDQKNAAMLDMLRRVTLMVQSGNSITKAPWFPPESNINVLQLASLQHWSAGCRGSSVLSGISEKPKLVFNCFGGFF